jgi:hypothetical protein
MLNKRELNSLKNALPDNGYQQIADNLSIGKETVRKVLTEPTRYRKDVIDEAILVVKTHKEYVESQKQQVKELKA